MRDSDLAPFVHLYICMHVYDAKDVPPDAPALLMRCLEQLLKATTFDPEAYRSGELHGFDQPLLAKALMFVAIDDPAPGATRYANGDWSDIGRILPVKDHFVRSAGWVSTIMSHFLRLCERAKEVYPAELFADQVLHVIDGGGPPLKGWHGTFLPARIAGLVASLTCWSIWATGEVLRFSSVRAFARFKSGRRTPRTDRYDVSYALSKQRLRKGETCEIVPCAVSASSCPVILKVCSGAHLPDDCDRVTDADDGAFLWLGRATTAVPDPCNAGTSILERDAYGNQTGRRSPSP